MQASRADPRPRGSLLLGQPSRRPPPGLHVSLRTSRPAAVPGNLPGSPALLVGPLSACSSSCQEVGRRPDTSSRATVPGGFGGGASQHRDTHTLRSREEFRVDRVLAQPPGGPEGSPRPLSFRVSGRALWAGTLEPRRPPSPEGDEAVGTREALRGSVWGLRGHLLCLPSTRPSNRLSPI